MQSVSLARRWRAKLECLGPPQGRQPGSPSEVDALCFSRIPHMRCNELPGLTGERVGRLAANWSDGGLWDDVLLLADRFWQVDEPRERVVRWHHLVLAVGNFKRQSGRRLRPTNLIDPIGCPTVRTSAFDAPCGAQVERDDERTWQVLCDELSGAGVATTTMLLAALWPEQHFVFDWRVRSTANALRVAAKLKPCPSVTAEMKGERAMGISFADYRVVRNWLRGDSHELVLAERALYQLSRKVAPISGRSWEQFAEAVAAELLLI